MHVFRQKGLGLYHLHKLVVWENSVLIKTSAWLTDNWPPIVPAVSNKIVYIARSVKQ